MFRRQLTEYVDETWHMNMPQMLLVERNYQLTLFFLTTNSANYAQIWVWPIDVTVRNDLRVDFYFIKDAYKVASTNVYKL